MSPTSYIAFSYHFTTDYEFVRTLANALVGQGIPAWYLDRLSEPADISMEQYLGGDFDWRKEPHNWHATFLDHLHRASGIIIVLSEGALASRETVGRGMWRERAAIDYFLADNPNRVRQIIRETETPGDSLVTSLVMWGTEVFALPQILRKSINDPNRLNRPTGLTGPVQLPEFKTPATVWYELVRRDLYDGQWHCRRCGLQSETYIFAHELPPEQCPRCGFKSLPFDVTALSENERQFWGKVEAALADLEERLKQKHQKNPNE